MKVGPPQELCKENVRCKFSLFYNNRNGGFVAILDEGGLEIMTTRPGFSGSRKWSFLEPRVSFTWIGLDSVQDGDETCFGRSSRVE